MPRYIPLTDIDLDNPSLMIDSEVPPLSIHATALARIRAATEMMESLSRTEVARADGVDLQHIAQAATMLMRDGCDLLGVLGIQLRALPAKL
ncbi:short-chain dehydrogenase [Pseudomonas sp. R5(2019)]|uniref:short-chain dehydrogenase n=1 Tax=Pseudomonas sp. R5(2019) TaxID=2697566 RepID=UPI001412A1CB|nr:short-chain dehydrogenase [Pseudomonas sp. R5(2019)]NBA94460.1 short-chain dehydrogenase [Pseudomonas sp. R5(2019)]